MKKNLLNLKIKRKLKLLNAISLFTGVFQVRNT